MTIAPSPHAAPTSGSPAGRVVAVSGGAGGIGLAVVLDGGCTGR